MLNRFDEWCERQERENNLWFTIPASLLFFGSMFCFLILIGIILGLI